MNTALELAQTVLQNPHALLVSSTIDIHEYSSGLVKKSQR